eukprot:CAMPEP_0181293208 /NCGR_PEP_ID=MMETSP1101-20121128/2941_1 /TAXON_ID=46948 /ORGANISM="Rhodomonas abbreviata, Strain Caron Lab Isolate" /LENGTH=105 /DNA_ID=CAMNT_0023397777 /DNA_START=309 /DNA_END=626 /DNA_ORIENTATION=+
MEETTEATPYNVPLKRAVKSCNDVPNPALEAEPRATAPTKRAEAAAGEETELSAEASWKSSSMHSPGPKLPIACISLRTSVVSRPSPIRRSAVYPATPLLSMPAM